MKWKKIVRKTTSSSIQPNRLPTKNKRSSSSLGRTRARERIRRIFIGKRERERERERNKTSLTQSFVESVRFPGDWPAAKTSGLEESGLACHRQQPPKIRERQEKIKKRPKRERKSFEWIITRRSFIFSLSLSLALVFFLNTTKIQLNLMRTR